MYGQNPVRKPREFKEGLYRVQEVFLTLQGEGPFAGIPAVFVRLAGCNLRCSFCDTDFESGWNNVMEARDLADLISKTSNDIAHLVVLTGGEPMLQDIRPLLEELHRERAGSERLPKFHVQVETAGTLLPDWVDDIRWINIPEMHAGAVTFVVSPKTPKIAPLIHVVACAVKYIVQAFEGPMASMDGLPNDVARINLKKDRIYLQPMDVPDPGIRELNIKHAVDMCFKHGYRLSLQTHKILNLK